jgi:hypothetical protein
LCLQSVVAKARRFTPSTPVALAFVARAGVDHTMELMSDAPVGYA